MPAGSSAGGNVPTYRDLLPGSDARSRTSLWKRAILLALDLLEQGIGATGDKEARLNIIDNLLRISQDCLRSPDLAQIREVGYHLL